MTEPTEKERSTENKIDSKFILSEIKTRLQNPNFREKGFSLDNNFFGFKKGYEMFLTGNQPVSPENISQVLPYLFPRLPQELLTSDKEIELILTNDSELFKNNSENLKTAPSRRRWYFIDDNDPKKRIIYWHIRDSALIDNQNLVGGTDSIEMMSFLSLLHILRKAEYHQLQIDSLLRGKFKILESQTEFDSWKQKTINVRLDFEDARDKAIDIFIQDLENELGRLKREKSSEKPFLLIGNDFSLRLILFTLVLEERDLNELQNKFKDELSKLETVINNKNMNSIDGFADFIKRYYLLTLLNKNYGKDKSLNDIYERIFSQDNYRRLGYKRLLYGVRKPLGDNSQIKRSILGEPVDYWDPKSFDQSLFTDKNSYVHLPEEKKPISIPIPYIIFNRLINQNQPILSIPYLNGKISPELAVNLINRGLVYNKVIGFIGKVGIWDNGETDKFQRGDIIIPSTVIEITGTKPEIEYNNHFVLKPEDLPFINGLKMMIPVCSTPAVTVQNIHDLINLNTALALDSEQYYLSELFEKYGLDTKIIGSFYVSDISHQIPQEDNKSITRPLSPEEGAIAVFMTTLFELIQIARYIEEEREKTHSLLNQISHGFLFSKN